MGAVTDLGSGDVDAVVPALLQQRLPECLGPVGVCPLADRQVAGVLPEGHLGVEGCRGGDMGRPPGHNWPTMQALHDLTQVLRRCAAAASNQPEAEF